MVLHIDIETYSSEDIKKSGLYRYVNSVDFEIMLLAFAFNNDPVEVIDLSAGEELPGVLIEAFKNDSVTIHAHNATFERKALSSIGIEIPIERWRCSMIKSSYCGFPLSLDKASKALGLSEDKTKLSTGRALIKYFCTPCKPTKTNGFRHRNFWYHNKIKWVEFKEYCARDVEAEREIIHRLSKYKIPYFERQNYILNEIINDAGILVDIDFAVQAYNMDNIFRSTVSSKIKHITGIDNPNSHAQMKKWISEAIGKEIKSLAKDNIGPLLEEIESEAVREVLNLRSKLSKSSTKKYVSMQNCVLGDFRARGLFQFYGANKTGRWAGRLIQLQNLPRNYIKELEEARSIVKSGDYESLNLIYDDVSNVLSQLIRTSFIAPQGKTLLVADFSAIEARVIAWLAQEFWRIQIFQTHGKIYEASASVMFGVPIEKIYKGSELRTKGKIAELALGFQGAVGALQKMGGEKMGLSVYEMKSIVRKWRSANRNIVSMWYDIEACAKKAIKTRRLIVSKFGQLQFRYDGETLTIALPSGRKLFYPEPRIGTNRFGSESIEYKGVNQVTGKWGFIDTYGGKLTENIVQAIARDLLAESMINLHNSGFKIVMHVHDEVIIEADKDNSEDLLNEVCEIMGRPIHWAEGLPLSADGYETEFYKKD